MTTSFSEGNTQFGDSLDDVHQFTGSVNVTGSMLSGSATTTASFGMIKAHTLEGQSPITINSPVTFSADITGSKPDGSAINASFTRVKAYQGDFSRIRGRSPIDIEADNFKISTDGEAEFRDVSSSRPIF